MESLLEERDKKKMNLVGLNFGIAQIWLFMKKKTYSQTNEWLLYFWLSWECHCFLKDVSIRQQTRSFSCTIDFVAWPSVTNSLLGFLKF